MPRARRPARRRSVRNGHVGGTDSQAEPFIAAGGAERKRNLLSYLLRGMPQADA